MSVKNLRVVITGAAAGAGRSVAELLADDGAVVVVSDVSEPATARLAAERSDIRVFQSNAGDEGEIDILFQRALSFLGGIDVLINNAGIAGPTLAAEQISLAQWNETLAVNVTGHFLCARRAIPHMKVQRSGSIINISSMTAKLGLPLRLPYSVSKAAVLSLTQNLARELGPFNIRVNAILPGVIEGDRIRRVIAAKADALGMSEAAYEAELVRFSSMRTMVTARDVAEMVRFLASSASQRISGQMIAVDGNLEFEG